MYNLLYIENITMEFCVPTSQGKAEVKNLLRKVLGIIVVFFWYNVYAIT